MSGTGGTALNAATRGKDRDMVTVSSWWRSKWSRCNDIEAGRCAAPAQMISVMDTVEMNVT